MPSRKTALFNDVIMIILTYFLVIFTNTVKKFAIDEAKFTEDVNFIRKIIGIPHLDVSGLYHIFYVCTK